MFLLFLPFCILLNLPSSLPSLQVPSTWQTPARKPGCIHNSSSKHQLIIRPAITHLPPHLSLISDGVFFRFIRRAEVPATEAIVSCGPCKAISSCSIYSLDWNCVLIREMMGQVFWYSFMSARSLIRRIAISRHGSGLWCQTASFVRLLIGVIYCPNRQSSCGFTA